MFVKEVLHDNPHADHQTVNEAWQAAGMEGTISASLVNKIRSQMGLTGNLRGRRRRKTGTAAPANNRTTGTARRRGRPPKRATFETVGTIQLEMRGRQGALVDLEADFDRLLFKVVTLGNLTRTEDALRRARRLLYEESPVAH